MPCKQDIELFLSKVKENISKGQFDFINRDKRELTRLGISYKEAVYIVEHLQIKNYYRGPAKDHNKKGNTIYEFGFPYDDFDLYIKLTFRAEDDLFIMSFHEAKKEIKYKYK